MDTAHLVVGVMDDSPDGLVLMEDLVDATLLFLKVDKSAIEIRRTRDRREAERISTSGECHLVITDLMWPVDGGPAWRAGLTIAEMAKTANNRSVIVVITGKQDQERDFRTEAKARGADVALTWDEAFGAGKVTSARDLARRLAPGVSSLVPEISSLERTTVGLVGLDTAAYSEEDDETQLEVVKSFLLYVREAWVNVAGPLVRPIFVFTGDGLFLGIAGDGGPRLALDVAVGAWRRFDKLAGYKTRLAVHVGPATIATLSSGAQQLLGHAVNWLFRAINAAPERGLVITDEYFASVLQDGRESPDGLRFRRREEIAKHGRLLVIHDVMRT